MPQRLRIQNHTLFSILCLASLSCCAPVAQQLEAIPVPATAQLASLPPPKCPDVQTVDEATEEPPVAEKTGEGSSGLSTQPSADSERALKRERDCYRHAEQAARAKLTRLQATTDNTLTALDEMKRRYTPAWAANANARARTP